METGSHIRLVLWKAYKAVESVDRMSIASTGLCLSDFAVLELLLHKGPQPVSVIGEKVLLTSGSITAAINRLQHKGYVRRKRDPGDGRVFQVQLSDDGRVLIEKAYAEHAGNLDKVAGILSPKERRELVRLVKKLGRHAETCAEQFRCPDSSTSVKNH